MLRPLVLSLSVIAAQACAGLSSDPKVAQSASELPRFEIRGLKTDAEYNEILRSTTYNHSGTIVALGDSAKTAQSYLVLLSVSRVSGGDPQYPRNQNDFMPVLVRNGAGEVKLYGGYRTSDEKWEPEKIEVRVISAIPAISITDTTKFRN